MRGHRPIHQTRRDKPRRKPDNRWAMCDKSCRISRRSRAPADRWHWSVRAGPTRLDEDMKMSPKGHVRVTDRLASPVDGTRHTLSRLSALVLERARLASTSGRPLQFTLDLGYLFVDQRESTSLPACSATLRAAASSLRRCRRRARSLGGMMGSAVRPPGCKSAVSASDGRR